jgi:hypothetical protein
VDTSTARNVIFGFAGTVVMCCRIFLRIILLSVPCVEEKWVGEPNGFAGAPDDRIKGEIRMKMGCNHSFHPEPSQPHFSYADEICNPEKRRGKIDFCRVFSVFSASG